MCAHSVPVHARLLLRTLILLLLVVLLLRLLMFLRLLLLLRSLFFLLVLLFRLLLLLLSILYGPSTYHHAAHFGHLTKHLCSIPGNTRRSQCGGRR
jgi:hypothetical protein